MLGRRNAIKGAVSTAALGCLKPSLAWADFRRTVDSGTAGAVGRIGADGLLRPHECYLDENDPSGNPYPTGPRLYLCWNAIPKDCAEIDVVLHFHGWSQTGPGMRLPEKVSMSGLDLSGRSRPTLGIIPRGTWKELTKYSFPDMENGGARRLIARAQEIVFQGSGRDALGLTRPKLGRLIVTAHSGGGAALSALLKQMPEIDEMHVFDAIYSPPTQIVRWLKEKLEKDQADLENNVARSMDALGAIRVINFSTEKSADVAVQIQKQIAGSSRTVQSTLGPRYRVDKVNPSKIRHEVPDGAVHAQLPRLFGPGLLADVARSFDDLTIQTG
jgi:hypothetical protein